MADRSETSVKNKQVIKKLLADPGNKTCADCKTATHPRWASWNLGIFLCIRCSGVHRSLGTHISKVRSVDLDSWSDMHLKEMIRWGNRRANIYWEAKLPPNYVPDDSKILNFIKTKYDLRRWVAGPTLPDPATLDGDDVPLSQVQHELRTEAKPVLPPKTRTSAAAQPAPAARPAGIDLLGDFVSAPKTAPPSTATAAPASQPGHGPRPTTLASARTGPAISTAGSRTTTTRAPASIDLLDFGAPTQTSSAPVSSRPSPAPSGVASQAAPRTATFDDLFGAPRAQPSSSQTSSQTSLASNTSSAQASQPRADLKKSILSLYAQKPSPSPAPAPVVSDYNQPKQQNQQPSHQSTQNDLFGLGFGSSTSNSSVASKPDSTGLTNSLAGLSFQNSAAPATPAAAPAAPAAQTSYNTSLDSYPSSNSVVPPVDDDDVFANVWK